MKITNKTFFIATTLLLAVGGLTAHAQKLPNKQEASVRAPENIKIDRKVTEWDGKFQAYNNATDIFYTLSNDDENLYLTVQSKLHDIEDKIIRGGISLTINHTIGKNDKEAVTVTYPVLRGADMALVSNTLARKTNAQRNNDGKILPPETTIDDLNQLLDAKSKSINITGIKSFTDESISVYNSEGIKAASQFDKEVVYTYELAIPLKYLSLSASFSYHIKVNEPAPIARTIGSGPPPPPMMVSSLSTTDFWGEYTLAKK